MAASVIVCEGKTDAILLSYFLIKVSGYKYYRNFNGINLPIQNIENEYCAWYKKESGEILSIWGVGGVDNIPYAISEIQRLNKLEFTFSKIVILKDRDKNTIEKILIELKNLFIEDDKMKFENNIWSALNIRDKFGSDQKYQVLPLIIPFNEEGALETFLMNALSEDKRNKIVIEKSKEFVISLKEVEFIQSDRLKLKAKLGVSLSILSPDKVFTLIDEMLKEIPWEDYEEIQIGFKQLRCI